MEPKPTISKGLWCLHECLLDRQTGEPGASIPGQKNGMMAKDKRKSELCHQPDRGGEGQRVGAREAGTSSSRGDSVSTLFDAVKDGSGFPRKAGGPTADEGKRLCHVDSGNLEGRELHLGVLVRKCGTVKES